MECALPLGLAWLLHRRVPQRPSQQELERPFDVRPPQRQQGEAQQCAGAAAAGNSGQPSVLAGSAAQGQPGKLPSQPPIDSAASQHARPRGNAATIRSQHHDTPCTKDLAQLQWMLLQLSLIQLAIRTGLWERIFRWLAIDVMRTAHRMSKGVLKGLLRPVIACTRPMFRAGNRGHARARCSSAAAAAAAGADAMVVGSVQDAAAASSDSHGADEAGVLRARPTNIVIISRPRLLSPSERAASSPNCTAAAATAAAAAACAGIAPSNRFAVGQADTSGTQHQGARSGHRAAPQHQAVTSGLGLPRTAAGSPEPPEEWAAHQEVSAAASVEAWAADAPPAGVRQPAAPQHQEVHPDAGHSTSGQAGPSSAVGGACEAGSGRRMKSAELGPAQGQASSLDTVGYNVPLGHAAGSSLRLGDTAWGIPGPSSSAPGGWGLAGSGWVAQPWPERGLLASAPGSNAAGPMAFDGLAAPGEELSGISGTRVDSGSAFEPWAAERLCLAPPASRAASGPGGFSLQEPQGQGLGAALDPATAEASDAASSSGSSFAAGQLGAALDFSGEDIDHSLSELDPAQEPVVAQVLGLPLCVSHELLHKLDSDAVRVLRCVSRGLYFEATRHLQRLTIQEDNLETLVYMPMHHVFPSLTCLTFQASTSQSTASPSASGGGAAAPAGALGAAEPGALVAAGGGADDAQGAAGVAGGSPGAAQRFRVDSLSGLDTGLLSRFLTESLPHLHSLAEIDLTEACLHTSLVVWASLVEGLPKGQPITVRLREPTSWWARGLTVGLPGDGRDSRDYFPPMIDALRSLQAAAPAVSVDLVGVTVRKHTASRLPQLCQLTCLRQLTLFGKSAVAVPHGHRLASHLRCFAIMPNLTCLELLSYEDVSDSELAVLASCPSLRHLYVDSLFIKHASGPVFENITSLAAARIKFILQPLTSIFPNLKRLRLGVLHSELNKKINSASVSCLAGCSESLEELVVCPVLWKGQWQVLPTLPGLRRLSLVHCKDLSHLREVLKVVGRSTSLEIVELQACASYVPPWPGIVATALIPGPGQAAAAAGAGGAGDLALGDAAGAGDDASGSEGQLGTVVEGSNLLGGLSNCTSLKELVIHDCTPALVRHLAAASLPQLRALSLEKMGPALRLPELQAAVLNLTGLTSLGIQEASSITAIQADQLASALSRPGLRVDWRSACTRPSLYTTRGFRDGDPRP